MLIYHGAYKTYYLKTNSSSLFQMVLFLIDLVMTKFHYHQIFLLLETSFIEIPIVKKKKLKILVSQILQEGLIKPSTSPLSFPILLIKKLMVHGGFLQITWHVMPSQSRMPF